MLWLALAVLAACAGVSVALPFLRARGEPEAPESDVDIYKSQLDDVASAEAAGDIDVATAAELRTEIERRIVKAPSPAPAAGGKASRVAALSVAAIVVLGAAALYAATGRPDAPSTARSASAQAAASENLPDVDTLIERLRARLESQPGDAVGWRFLGWAYLETGRAPEAVAAYANAIAIEPDNSEFQSGYGEALTAANGGMVPPAARGAFQRAVAREPGNERARYYLALAKAQGGDIRGAVDDWIAALRAAPADSQWAPRFRAEAENAARQIGIDISRRLPAAPVAGTAAQQQMIADMVDGLEQRLAADPNDAEGWLRLMQARMVLGQPERASAALQRALAAFANDPPTQQRLRAAAAELDVPGAN